MISDNVSTPSEIATPDKLNADMPGLEAARENRQRGIEEFIQRFAPCADADLLADMMITICRLANDNCGRGDLKILARSLKELRYAFKIFARWREPPKVSIFGSSRTPETHPEYVTAVKFAQKIKQAGWMVITGAGDGIMGAGHHGATRDKSFGVAISLPFEQKTNKIIEDDEKLINFKYFFTRKLLFIKEAKAIALFPGGFGTQDEGFESLTLIQTGKAHPMPVVMVDAPGGTYWQHWRTYVQAELLRTGMISEEDMSLFKLTDDVDVAVREITHFYRHYHSCRFVQENMVMRLNVPLSDAFLEQINDRFSGLLSSGRFVQVPHAVDGEQGELPDKPRLVFCYNRKSSGVLRQMINAINNWEPSRT